MKKSSRFQIQAVQRQFQALFTWPEPSGDGETYARRDRPLVRDDRVESIRVAVTTPALMAERPSRSTSDGNLCSTDDDRAFFLLDSAMRVLAEVEQDAERWTPQETSSHAGETVEEAIARLSDPAAVAFILERHVGYDIQDSRSVGGYDVVLYKAPRGWAIPDWIAKQRRRAAEHLSRQILAIDDGADAIHREQDRSLRDFSHAARAAVQAWGVHSLQNELYRIAKQTDAAGASLLWVSPEAEARARELNLDHEAVAE